jgi:hypothetical protein
MSGEQMKGSSAFENHMYDFMRRQDEANVKNEKAHEKIFEIINGNGKPGMRSIQDDHARKIQELQDRKAEDALRVMREHEKFCSNTKEYLEKKVEKKIEEELAELNKQAETDPGTKLKRAARWMRYLKDLVKICAAIVAVLGTGAAAAWFAFHKFIIQFATEWQEVAAAVAKLKPH